MNHKNGHVYLVGAGCGPADWITVRGARLLQSCDAVVYDDLIAAELLDWVPSSARTIYMGKRMGQHSSPQKAISQTLIALAQVGYTVVRLKGGDPFVFGRGGEEIQALQQAGIPFAVVPGISSAIAIPGQAGIPVTHRGISRSFHVITAQTAEGASDSLAQLAEIEGTLVILMGLSQLDRIVEQLLAAGKAPDTPSAVLSGGCAPDPAVVRSPLKDLPKAAKKAGVLPPAVIVVGNTAALNLSPTLNRPLEGVQIALTGTPAIQERLRRPLLDLGARPFSLMTTQVEETETNFDWNRLTQDPNWVVLTSQNGVEYFFRALNRAQVDLRTLSFCRFAVIGPATGAALQRHGISPDLCPEVYTTQGLADALQNTVEPGQTVRLFRSQLATPELFQCLSPNFPTEEVPLYTLRPGPSSPEEIQAKLESAKYLIFSSASGVNFLFHKRIHLPSHLTCVCIGPVTSRALAARCTVPFLTAPDISAESMIQTVAAHAAEKAATY